MKNETINTPEQGKKVYLGALLTIAGLIALAMILFAKYYLSRG